MRARRILDGRLVSNSCSRPTATKPRPTARKSRRSSPRSSPPTGRGSAHSKVTAIVEFVTEWRKTLYEANYLAPGWPAEYGGAGLSATRAGHPGRGVRQGRCGHGRTERRVRHPDARQHPAHVGLRGAEAALSAPHPVGRGHLVPGLLGAERRLRPRQRRPARRARRRRVGAQRPEDLDLGGPPRRPHLHARPHRPRLAQAQGHLVPARRRWTSPGSRCGRSR